MNQSNKPGTGPSWNITLWERGLLWRLMRWVFRWRVIRNSLLVIATLITLTALTFGVENWRGKRAWDGHLKELEAQGEQLDLASFLPPLIPDKENLAMTPLLRKIYDFTRTTNGTYWTDSNVMTRLFAINTSHRMPGNTKSTKSGSIERDTFTNLESWHRFYEGNTNYPQPDVSGNSADSVLVALSRFEAELKELHTAAANRPDCRFPVHYDEENPSYILLPHLAIITPLQSVLMLKAIARMEQGQSMEAMADLQLGFRFANTLRKEPFRISHLISRAGMALQLQTVREGLRRHAWTDVQLVELDRTLATMDLLTDMKRVFRSERAATLASLDYIRRQKWILSPTEFQRIQTVYELKVLKTPRNIPEGWFYQNMVSLSESCQLYFLPSIDVEAHRVVPFKARRYEEQFKKTKNRPYSFLAALNNPNALNNLMKVAQTQTYVDLARIACALERYRLAEGQLPDTLPRLVPRFMESLPHDIITGKPLTYQREEDGGYRVYSTGWNQTDDGGNSAWTLRNIEDKSEDAGDWVWHMPGLGEE